MNLSKGYTMRSRILLIVVLLAAALALPEAVSAQGTAFTYQGQLTDTNGPANGNYDFLFLVFDSLGNGVQQGITVGRFGVSVSNGLFTTTLDFGSNTFTGLPLWLEIQVAPANTAQFVTLAPRQPFTSTPYAIRALNAASSDTATSVPWVAINGVPPGFADGVDDNTFYSAGPGLNLVGTTFSLNATYTDTLYWKLAGNAGTTPGVNFLGTTDNQALELKVNGMRALRLEPTTNAPNVIGGSSANTVASSVYGAVIDGGADNIASGRFATIGGGLNNQIHSSAHYAIIAGGWTNTVQLNGQFSTISGGSRNVITTNAQFGHIGGGSDNTIGDFNHPGDFAQHASIGGGYANKIETTAHFAVAGGGYQNMIRSGANSATIAGGAGNEIESGAVFNAVGGGADNVIRTGTGLSVISGGQRNQVGPLSPFGSIGGGVDNTISATVTNATIAGGTNNVIGVGANSASIGGGEDNVIYSGGRMNTIAGGSGNQIRVDGIYHTIGGGRYNRINTGGGGSTVAGGFFNWIESTSSHNTIGGGAANNLGTNAQASTIAGGQSNDIDGWNSSIGGGLQNTISNSYSTIAGGRGNRLIPSYGFIGGGYSNMVESLASYSSIGGGYKNLISSNAAYATVAGGDGNVIQYDANDATIGGGASQIIGTNADYSTIGGGNLNTIGDNASRATIAGGAGHVIVTTADYATIPGGRYAQANHYGELAYASGRFASTGDAQTSTYVVRRTTSNATQSELFLDGSTLRLTVPDGASWTFEALVVARSSTGDTAGYRLIGVVENVGSAMGGTFQATQVLREDVASWDASASTDNVNDALVIRVTGAAGTTIRWVATVRTVEVTY